MDGLFSKIVPPLSHALHKGQAGRIAIVGGSFEYTGAPYYAAMTAMKLGVDIVHVFCDESAAVPLKCYSPDLIVHPYLSTTNNTLNKSDAEDEKNQVSRISEWLDRMHGVLIGPGAGRHPKTIGVINALIPRIIERKIPLVIDADGLFAIQGNLELIKGYNKAIITPNVVELHRLCRYFELLSPRHLISDNQSNNSSNYYNPTTNTPTTSNRPPAQLEMELSRQLEGVVVLSKGNRDIITNHKRTVFCDEESSPRRCGGQGDILAGACVTFAAWAHMAASTNINSSSDNSGSVAAEEDELLLLITACTMASKVTRAASRLTFEEYGRSMTSSQIIPLIPRAFSNKIDA